MNKHNAVEITGNIQVHHPVKQEEPSTIGEWITLEEVRRAEQNGEALQEFKRRFYEGLVA